MAEDNTRAADGQHPGTEHPAKRKPHPTILALAWLIGRRMAREHFADAADANDARNSQAAKAEPPGARAGDGNTDTS